MLRETNSVETAMETLTQGRPSRKRSQHPPRAASGSCPGAPLFWVGPMQIQCGKFCGTITTTIASLVSHAYFWFSFGEQFASLLIFAGVKLQH